VLSDFTGDAERGSFLSDYGKLLHIATMLRSCIIVSHQNASALIWHKKIGLMRS
jgi:hypothetical protein